MRMIRSSTWRRMMPRVKQIVEALDATPYEMLAQRIAALEQRERDK